MYRPLLSLLVLAGLLAGCSSLANTRSREKILDDTLKSYAATIRWSDIAQAEVFLEPAYRNEHPLTVTDRGRYRQVQVSYYHEQPAVIVNENEIRQTVEIGLVNVNTQVARSIIDRQTWRYDEAAKAWWLTSGLPDITRHD
jgi:hypothetical protein